MLAAVVLLLAAWQGAAAPADSIAPATLSDDSFADSIASEAAWVVDFYAPWCASSQQLAPEFETASRMSDEDNLEAKFGMVDITANSKLRSAFEVQSFPRVAVFAPWARKAIGGRVTEGLSWVAHPARSAGDLHWLASRASGPWPRLASSMDEVPSITEGDSALAGRPPAVAFVLASGAPRQVQERFRQLAVERRLQSSVFIRLEGAAPEGEAGSAVAPAADWLPASPGRGTVWRLEAGASPRRWSGSAHDASSRADEFDATAADGLGDWIDSSGFRTVTELDRVNFRQLADDQRLLVVAIYDPADERRTSFMRKTMFHLASGRPVAEAASGCDAGCDVAALPQEVHAGFLFGMLNGIEFAAFADRYRGGEEGGLPRVLVMDHASNKYYVDSEADEPEELLQFLLDIYAGLHPAIDVSASVLPWWWAWEQRASSWLRGVNGVAEALVLKPILELLEAVELRAAGDPVDTATRVTIVGVLIGVVMVFVAAGCLVCSCVEDGDTSDDEEPVQYGGEADTSDEHRHPPVGAAASEGKEVASAAAWGEEAAAGARFVDRHEGGTWGGGGAGGQEEGTLAAPRLGRVEVRYEEEEPVLAARRAPSPQIRPVATVAAGEDGDGLRRRGVEQEQQEPAAEQEPVGEQEPAGERQAVDEGSDSDGGGWITA